MLYINPPARFNNRIGFRLKLNHWRQICWYGIRRPNLRMDNAVERPVQLLNRAQAGKAVLAI